MSSLALKVVSAVTGAAAALCLPGILAWILANPGTEDEYARGWQMAYQVIIAYPIAWAITPAAVRRLIRESSEDRDQLVATTNASIRLILLLAATARFAHAIQIMLQT